MTAHLTDVEDRPQTHLVQSRSRGSRNSYTEIVVHVLLLMRNFISYPFKTAGWQFEVSIRAIPFSESQKFCDIITSTQTFGTEVHSEIFALSFVVRIISCQPRHGHSIVFKIQYSVLLKYVHWLGISENEIAFSQSPHYLYSFDNF